MHIRKLDNNRAGGNINPKSNTPHPPIVVWCTYVTKITLSVHLGHKAQNLCHNFDNCSCWTRWYSSLQLGGLSVIVKVYGNNIFQGFFKDNNLASKLSLNWHLEFMGFHTSFLTPWFPFLPTFPQLLCPCNGFLQGILSFYTFTSFIPTPILVSLVAYWHASYVT